jgi:hypothetical protein
MHTIRVRRLPSMTGVVAVIALTALAACGAPQRNHTLSNAPDIAAISTANTRDLSASQRDKVERSRAACTAIDSKVRTILPDLAGSGATASFALVDGQCQWTSSSAASRGAPELIVMLLDRSGGGATFDETTRVIKDERTVAGVGERAAFDPQTATLYIVKADRLWYLQLIGSTSGDVEANLTTLGRALMQTSVAR